MAFLLFGFGQFLYSQIGMQVEKLLPGIPEGQRHQVLAQMQIDLDKKPETERSSGIFITQVGDYNRANAAVSAAENQLALKQGGTANIIELRANVKQLEGEVVQQGSGNYILDFFNDPKLEVPLGVKQTGNNLHFERHGTNSIGSKIKIDMNGSSRSVIVRNFK